MFSPFILNFIVYRPSHYPITIYPFSSILFLSFEFSDLTNRLLYLFTILLYDICLHFMYQNRIWNQNQKLTQNKSKTNIKNRNPIKTHTCIKQWQFMRRLSYFWHFLFYCFYLTCSTCIQGIDMYTGFYRYILLWLNRCIDILDAYVTFVIVYTITLYLWVVFLNFWFFACSVGQRHSIITLMAN